MVDGRGTTNVMTDQSRLDGNSSSSQISDEASEAALFDRQWKDERSTSALRWRILVWLLGIDVLSIVIGFGAGLALRTFLFGDTLWDYLLWSLIPIHLCFALHNKAYSSIIFNKPLGAARTGVNSMTMALIAIVFFGFVFQSTQNLPRFAIGTGFILAGTAMALGRFLFIRNLSAIIGGHPFRVILICEKDQPIPAGNYDKVVIADQFFDPDLHDPVMYDRFADLTHSAHRVVITCRPERRATWAHALKGAGVQGEVLMPELASLAPLGVAACGAEYTLVVASGPLGLAKRAIKRGFDLAFAGCAIVVLSPLFAAISLAIKIDTPGPVFFRQDRIGRGNRIFKIYKFRSMRVDKEDKEGHRSASRDDDRITRVGRFIRRTSIDEMPQLINVLRGDMSIVGPRPHALGSRAANKLFWEIDERYWHRHAAKPGLTGLAQVRGFRGATLIEADLANRLQADLEYLEDWSLWRDIKLILFTIRVLFHRNAF